MLYKASVYLYKFLNPFWWYKIIRLKVDAYYSQKKVNKVKTILPHLFDKEYNHQPFVNQYLTAILHYAYKHCAYYKQVFKDISLNIDTLENFNKLPLLNKSIIQKNAADIISNELLYVNYHEKRTSGSTGNPLFFNASNLAADIDIAHLAFQYGMMGYKDGDHIAVFAGWNIPDSLQAKNVYWELSPYQTPFHGYYFYSSYYLKEQNIPFYLAHLAQHESVIFNGYPSALNELATYLLKNNYHFPFKIKGIRLTGENCYAWQIENIRLAFGCPVHLQYGNTEVCLYAFTKDDGYEYYCSPHYGLVEVLDEQGLHVKAGEEGEVVVTSFFNHAQPFIRYRTGDMAIYKNKENGVVILQNLLGRKQDYLVADGNEKIHLLSLIFRHKALKHIIKWQIVQDKVGEVLVRIVPNKTFSSQHEEEIREDFFKKSRIKTTFEYVSEQEIIYGNTGKQTFLIQNIKRN